MGGLRRAGRGSRVRDIGMEKEVEEEQAAQHAAPRQHPVRLSSPPSPSQSEQQGQQGLPKIIVPTISARKTCPPVNTDSSQELLPKARAAGQWLPKIAHRKKAPSTLPAICEAV